MQDEDSNDEENLDQNLKADTFVEEEDLTNENLDDDSNKDEDSLNNILFDTDNYDSSNNKAVRTEGILGAINDLLNQH